VSNDDIEKLLAGLDSEDSDDVDETPEAEVSQARPDRGFTQLRKAYKALERDTNKLRKENEELSAFRATVEQERKVATATGAGLTEQQAAAYLRLYPDVTPEGLKEFKRDILGVQDETTEADVPDFAPTVVSSEPASKVYSKEDFERLMRTNPAKGWDILNSGKVKF